jgi:hypothetical protein
MIGQELKILFEENRAQIGPDKFLSFDQLGLPAIAKSFKAPAYWTIHVLNVETTSQKLYCSIQAYHVGQTHFDNHQLKLQSILNEIEIITFRSIDTAGLLKTLSGSQPFTYKPHLYAPLRSEREAAEAVVISSISSATAPQQAQQAQPKPTVPEVITTQKPRDRRKVIRESFQVSIKDLQFKFGCVAFKKSIKGIRDAIDFTIFNDEIREEFDAVKNYFGNVLKTKKIAVEIIIELRNDEIESVKATSEHIDRISKELIDSVKFEFVRTTTRKKPGLEIDKSLFTMEEYFQQFADQNFKSNTFFRNEQDLLNDLLEIHQTKHYKHLRYLSAIHASGVMKLRFVLKPFSFIFLIEGERNYHVIWETLDTREATYVWHTKKDLQELKRCLRKIEDIIHVIKVQGKTAYISSAEEPFRRIYHDYSEVVNGFIKWKGELESVLS